MYNNNNKLVMCTSVNVQYDHVRLVMAASRKRKGDQELHEEITKPECKKQKVSKDVVSIIILKTTYLVTYSMEGALDYTTLRLYVLTVWEPIAILHRLIHIKGKSLTL